MSKVENQQMPKIRFKGFNEGWEQKKLGQLVLSLDAGVSVNSVDDEVSNYWILKTSCITGGVFNENERKAVVDKNEIIRLKEPLLSNSILMSRMNTPTLVGVTGYVEEVTKNIFLPDRLWQFKLKENKVDVCWLSNLFLTEKNLQIRQSNATGTSGSMKNISKASVLQEEIFITSLIEQTQIGNFFQELDKLIELQTCTVELAETYKKLMLQKMFPQKDETVPKVRFEGFSGDWVEQKLGNSTKLITKGTTPKINDNCGEINFIKVENLNNGLITPTHKTSKFEHDNYLKRSKLEDGDILFSIAGTLGRTAIVNKDILPANTNQALSIIRGYDFNTYFLITILSGNTVKEYIRKNPTIGAQPNLSLEQVRSLQILSPSLEEQTKIGNYFQELDRNIESEKKKLEQYQTMKRAMLQRMFV